MSVLPNLRRMLPFFNVGVLEQGDLRLQVALVVGLPPVADVLSLLGRPERGVSMPVAIGLGWSGRRGVLDLPVWSASSTWTEVFVTIPHA